MTLKKTLMTGALIVGATAGLTSATMAQAYYGRPNSGPGFDRGYYNYNSGPAIPDTERGGPGPRVGAGSGAGIGAQR